MNRYFNLAMFFYDIASNNIQQSAIIYNEESLNYDGLNRLSNKLANYLLVRGAIKNDVVGILNTKTIIGYAAMLACLKIGVAYTNIDEGNPPSRLKKILGTCQLKLMLSDHEPSANIAGLIIDLKIDCFNLVSDKSYSKLDGNDLQLSKSITGNCPAYLMFTSGSTGNPKGVLISHANVLSFLAWSIPRFNITPADRFAQVSPVYFDNSVFDFYSALFSGASLVPITEAVSKNPLALIKYVDKKKCTIWFSVPSLLVYLISMRVLTNTNLKTIRAFIFGGEGFPKKELKKLYDLYNARSTFVNVYGPTEGTCICSSHDITNDDFMDMVTLAPLGHINPNFNHIIVNDFNEKVEHGKKGELCLIGPNVALGYYNDPARTEYAFIQNPDVKTHREIIYKTGDITHEKHGLLWFDGRTDNQIKHMGYRIELEEIEVALNSLLYVIQSAVIYKREQSGYGKIIAFVSSEDEIDERKIKDDLHDILPVYMVPNIIEVKRSLAKNSNGKIDKKKLLDIYQE